MERTFVASALSSTATLQGVAPDVLSALVSASSELACSTHDKVVTQGEQGSRMYVVVSGEFCAYKSAVEGGTLRAVKVYGVGATFGEHALRSAPYPASVKCTQAGLLRVVDRSILPANYSAPTPAPATVLAIAAEKPKRRVVVHSRYSHDERPTSAPFPAKSSLKPALKSSLKPIVKSTTADDLGEISPPKIPRDELLLHGLLGEGTFGSVRLVSAVRTQELFALKIIEKSQDDAGVSLLAEIAREMSIVQLVSGHPLIVKLVGSYDEPDSHRLLLELCPGGELSSLIQMRRLKEAETKFYAACICSAIGHVHSMSVTFRDLKPENLLFAGDGYLKLCDFGCAKVIAQKVSLDGDDDSFTTHHVTYDKDFGGTVEYLAPEVLLDAGHSFAVDWWATGVIVFEMLAGATPFEHPSPEEVIKRITVKPVKWPLCITRRAREFISALLERDPTQRLGSGKLGGAAKMQEHPFLSKIDFEALRRKELAAPHTSYPPLPIEEVPANWADALL